MLKNHRAYIRFAIDAIRATGYPDMAKFGIGNKSLQGLGIDRAGGYFHPLSEADGETLNLWGLASLWISASLGWIEADRKASIECLKDAVSVASPTVDLQILLRRSRYDDRALLLLCSYAERGLQAKFEQAFNNR